MDASRVLVAITERALADTGGVVTLSQHRALAVIAEDGPWRLAAVATALAVTPPTATRMCDRLVAKGLVRREVNRRDRRQIQVLPTELGRRTVAAIADRRRELVAGVLAVIPSAEQAAIAASLDRLTAAGSAADVGA